MRYGMKKYSTSISYSTIKCNISHLVITTNLTQYVLSEYDFTVYFCGY